MRTGNYIQQSLNKSTHKSFVPNKLPFDLHIDHSIQHLLSNADLSLGRLDGVAETLPDIDFFLLTYIKKEATLSSQVEGTRATFSDVLKAESKIKSPEMSQDVDEVLNYIRAMNYGLKRLKELPLSLRLIKEIHKVLLTGVRGEGKDPGEFRKTQNWIGGPTIETASYVPPPHNQLLELMGNLEKFFHEDTDLPILLKTGLIHYQFETVHPFLDGNGRVGRLLIAFYLCQQGVLKKPLLYLSEFFKENRQSYYDKLGNAHDKDDIEGWLRFFLTGVVTTSERAVESIRKITKLREEHTHKIMGLGRSAKTGMVVLNMLYKKPFATSKDIADITGLRKPNVHALIKKLENIGILKEITGQERNRIYAYQTYIDLFK